MSKNLYNAIQLFLEATRPSKPGMRLNDKDAFEKAAIRPDDVWQYRFIDPAIGEVDPYVYRKHAAINKSIRRHNDREDVARFKRGATPSREQFRQIRRGEQDRVNRSMERADIEHAKELKDRKDREEFLQTLDPSFRRKFMPPSS